MPRPSPKHALRAAVERQEFSPVYYLFGDDDFLKEDAVRQLVATAVDPATRDFNLEIRRAAELDAGTLGSLLATPPMMAERRVLVVRDVGALKKEARRALDRYLEKPAADTVLILVSPAGAKSDKELEGASTPLQYEPLSEGHVTKWIAHHAAKLGSSISVEAAELLQSAAGNDLPSLAVELEKLASFSAGEEIGVAAVEAIVGVRRDETMAALLDAVAERNVRRALELVPGVLRQPKTTAVQVVMALASQTMAIGFALARRAHRVPAAAMKGELFGFLKSAGSAYTGRPWGDAVNCWIRNFDRWTSPEVDEALAHLLAADRSLKESGVSTDEQVLRTAILSMCVPASRRGAA